MKKSLFIIGIVILLITLSTPFFGDYADFFKFLGGGLVFGGIAYQLLLKYPQSIFISNEEISQYKKIEQLPITKPEITKISIKTVVFILIIGGFILNQILIWRTILSGNFNKPFSVSINITKKNGK